MRSSPRTAAILVVIDGLTPSLFEEAVGDRSAPTLSQLAEAGEYRRAVTTFPSLTPVCLTSIATGAHPDVHHIPHLVWWNRAKRRVVEYGSSFGAIRAAGTRRSIRDTIVGMNQEHLSRDAETIYEAAERENLTAAAVNITCYRGAQRYLPTVPGIAPATFGPRRFFFYNLYESDPIGAPLAVRDRAAGTVDEYAAAAGRWLVTRDGFDVLVYYLSDLDFASHAFGPDGVREQLRKTDGCVRALADAAGGIDQLLERYRLLVCSDHGQTNVLRAERLQDHVDPPAIVTASNRAGMIYTDDARTAAAALDGVEAVDSVFFLENDEVVARRNGDEDASLLDEFPLGRERVGAALRNPNAGEVLVNAADGWEFADLGGSHHAGGGSHGSLSAGDSEVPMLGIGIPPPARTIDVKSALLGESAHTGAVIAARHRMVEQQLRGRDIDDERVLGAMERVPREVFVPEELAEHAYDDAALPIGMGQTISQPAMVALICELLALRGDERVLDVGTGSGYQAAVLAELAREVHTIERLPELAEQARRNLAEAGYSDRVIVHVGDGTLGDPEHAPFTAIAVAAAAPEPPRSLYEQLEPGGRLAVPVGSRHDQRLQLVVRTEAGPKATRSVPCRFVPLVGAEGFAGN